MSNQTYTKLKALHLSGMAECYKEMVLEGQGGILTAEEVLTLMVDREEDKRVSSKRQRLIKKAAFEQPQASLSEIDYDEGRKLDRGVVLRLETCDFIDKSRNIVIMGATGSGKSYLACALGMSACLKLYSVRFTRMRSLLDDLRLASDLKLTRYTKELKKCNLLIIDDWMLSEIDEIETQFLYELIHDRELTEGTSTMLCTQYDLNGCAMKMANRTMSDAIYDRLEHNAYIVDLSQNPNYPSMRERYGRNKRPI